MSRRAAWGIEIFIEIWFFQSYIARSWKIFDNNVLFFWQKGRKSHPVKSRDKFQCWNIMLLTGAFYKIIRCGLFWYKKQNQQWRFLLGIRGASRQHKKYCQHVVERIFPMEISFRRKKFFIFRGGVKRSGVWSGFPKVLTHKGNKSF